MMDPRDQLTDLIAFLESSGYVAGDVKHLRDEWFPELPDGHARVKGCTWTRATYDRRVIDSWQLIAPNQDPIGSGYIGEYLRDHGQPIPDPTPDITVGCIVRARIGSTFRVVHIEDDGVVFGRGQDGRWVHTAGLATLTYVAASWDEVPS